jgi:hypothetical protein
VRAANPASRSRNAPISPQSVPGSASPRAARTAHSTGFSSDRSCIHDGIRLRAIKSEEKKRSGNPMNWATAIIDAS